MDIYGTPGDGEGVKLGVIDYKKAVLIGLRPHNGEDPSSHPVNVALDLGLSDQAKLLVGLTTKIPADSNLIFYGDGLK